MAKHTVNLKAVYKKTFITRLQNLDNTDVMTKINQVLANMCKPYVPYLTGALQRPKNTVVDEKGVHYETKYARYQYYGDTFQHTLEPHPLASSRWDQAMMRDHSEEFNKKIGRIITKAIKEGK